MAVIIDAKPLFLHIREEVKREVERLKKQGTSPGLAVILFEDDPSPSGLFSIRIAPWTYKINVEPIDAMKW